MFISTSIASWVRTLTVETQILRDPNTQNRLLRPLPHPRSAAKGFFADGDPARHPPRLPPLTASGLPAVAAAAAAAAAGVQPTDAGNDTRPTGARGSRGAHMERRASFRVRSFSCPRADEARGACGHRDVAPGRSPYYAASSPSPTGGCVIVEAFPESRVCKAMKLCRSLAVIIELLGNPPPSPLSPSLLASLVPPPTPLRGYPRGCGGLVLVDAFVN